MGDGEVDVQADVAGYLGDIKCRLFLYLTLFIFFIYQLNMSDDYIVESTFAKFWRKAKAAPFVPLGILGLVGAVTYGGVTYKNRGAMSTSVYIMQYRVIAQSMVVVSVTLGVAATVLPNIFRKMMNKSKDTSDE